MDVVFGPTPPLMGKHKALAANTDAPYEYLIRCIKDDPRLRGRMIDVGCGEWPPGPVTKVLYPLYQLAAELDGIDPFPGVKDHPWLTHAWVGDFGENCPVPSNTYDTALAINVVEHLADPLPFLRGIQRVLKPGGMFIATTPSSRHPFAWCVRAIERAGLKHAAAKRHDNVNDYPAYYRCNSTAQVTRLAKAAGFVKVSFFHHPAVNWRQHLPTALRPAGYLYDELIGIRSRGLAQQCMFILEKAGSEAGPASSRTSRVAPVSSLRSTAMSVEQSTASSHL